MNQQEWIITFNTDVLNRDEQASILKEFVVDALPEVEITRKTKSEYTQNGDWVDLVIKLAEPGGVIITVIGVISAYLKSTHSASINIEIEENKIKKFEAKNITDKTMKEIFKDLLKSLQMHSSEEQKGIK